MFSANAHDSIDSRPAIRGLVVVVVVMEAVAP
jgi:hypothetical protein